MGIYDRLAATANRLFGKYGRTVQLQRQSAGSGDYDPATGTATPLVATSEPRKVIAGDQPGSQISQRFGQNFQPGSLVQQAEKWVYMDSNGPKPKMQDKVIDDDGTIYTIFDVQEVRPGPTEIMYLLVLRV